MTIQPAKNPTLTNAARAWLKARGLDPALCEEKLGFTSGHLKPDGPEWLKIPYEQDGEVVNWKLRQLDEKRFQQRKGGAQIFWRYDCIGDAALAEEPLLITEGEFDAVAAIMAGHWRTVSIPAGAPETSVEDRAGAKYWFLEHARAKIEPIKQIIIAADADGPGRALLSDLSALLGPARCRFVAYPEDCKDLNDVLLKHGLEAVKRVIDTAPWKAVAGVYRFDELPPVPDLTIWRPRFEGFSEIGDLIPLCPGHLSIWTGLPSHGKSTLLNACAWAISEREGIRIAHGAFETTPQREYLQDLISHKTGFPIGHAGMPEGAVDSARAWVQEHIVFINADSGLNEEGEMIDATLEWFIQCVQTAVVRYGCRFIILDPWSQIDHDLVGGEREDQYIRKALRRFRTLARIFDVHIAVVAHPMKARRDADGAYEMPEGYEISGAAHWYNFADVGVTAHKAPETKMEDGEEVFDENSRRVLIRVWKVKNHRMMNRPGDVYANVDSNTGRYTAWQDKSEVISYARRRDVYD